MNVEEVLTRVCRMPIDFYAGSQSMIELLTESGVDACLTALTVPNLSAYITGHSEVIEAWLRWSANKRVASGWYFERQASGFVVGYYPNGELLKIAEPAPACAEFIVREVKELAGARRAHRFRSFWPFGNRE